MILSSGRKKPRIHPTAFVAENAVITGSVTIGAHSSIWFGAVLRADAHAITIGERSNVQDNAVFHADEAPVRVGDDVSVGHGAIVHSCTIGSRCVIGMGAIVLTGAEIGEDCLIGAGAVIKEGEQIPLRSLVVGIPAKVVRSLTNTDVKKITENAREYVRLKEVYRKMGI